MFPITVLYISITIFALIVLLTHLRMEISPQHSISHRDMAPIFASLESRRKLLFRLQKAGLQARIHSYEYFIRKSRFVCMLVLSPTQRSATIYEVRWNRREAEEVVEEISKLLKEMDPAIRHEYVS